MIRNGRYKYIHYVGMTPMLFDLEADPNERKDLGGDPAFKRTIAECEVLLRTVVNPEAADKQARADQSAASTHRMAAERTTRWRGMNRVSVGMGGALAPAGVASASARSLPNSRCSAATARLGLIGCSSASLRPSPKSGSTASTSSRVANSKNFVSGET